MRQSVRDFGLAVLAAAGLVIAAPAAAQVPAQEGSFEIGGFVGATYGGTTAQNEFRPMGGVNLTYDLIDFRKKSLITVGILPDVEFSYFPGINRQESGTFSGTGRPFMLRYNVPVTDFNAGVHIRFLIHDSPFAPYAAVGFGQLANSSRTVTATYTDASGSVLQQLPVTGDAEFAVNGGGGLRIYPHGSRLGFRVEAKIYKPTGNFGNTFGKVEAAVFWQFSRKQPEIRH